MDTHAIEGNRKSIERDSGGLRPSMSMTDLMNHIGNCISEQMTSGSFPSAKASECHEMLENISQILLSDSQCPTGLDERSLMKKVNSLCSLLQDPDCENRNEFTDPAKASYSDTVSDSIHSMIEKTNNTMQGARFEYDGGDKEKSGLTRKESFSDLLLHLPRIASLPGFSNFLGGIQEDDDDDDQTP